MAWEPATELSGLPVPFLLTGRRRVLHHFHVRNDVDLGCALHNAQRDAGYLGDESAHSPGII